jgi:rRNA maturation endonuclease Nob1
MYRVDTAAVFKHPVHCFGCHEAFYFTLRKIGGAERLACPQCGSDLNLADRAYESLITWAKEMTASIDQIQNSTQ